jgi:hypothetical protein
MDNIHGYGVVVYYADGVKQQPHVTLTQSSVSVAAPLLEAVPGSKSRTT